VSTGVGAWTSTLDVASNTGDVIRFASTDLRSLFDSSVLADRHVHVEIFDEHINLSIVAERSKQIPVNRSVLDAHHRLIAEADAQHDNSNCRYWAFPAPTLAISRTLPVSESNTRRVSWLRSTPVRRTNFAPSGY